MRSLTAEEEQEEQEEGSEKPGTGEPSEAGPSYTVLPSEQGQTLGEEKAEEQS